MMSEIINNKINQNIKLLIIYFMIILMNYIANTLTTIY